jgi:predicted dienelactone hydrolase
VVVFIQHPGSDESVWKGVPFREIMTAMKKAANLQSSLDRFADVPFVLDQLERWNAEEGHALHNKLDLEHIGMCGHSYGAVTTQALMGQKFPSDRNAPDPRLDAFLPMSPSCHRTMSPEESFGKIKAPVLCMTGTMDGSPINPATTPESRVRVYHGLPAGDKYQLIFKDGEHHAFGDGGRRARKRIPHHHLAILKISTQFWNAYLKNDLTAKTWLQSGKVREDTKLVEGDTWEWK